MSTTDVKKNQEKRIHTRENNNTITQAVRDEVVAIREEARPAVAPGYGSRRMRVAAMNAGLRAADRNERG